MFPLNINITRLGKRLENEKRFRRLTAVDHAHQLDSTPFFSRLRRQIFSRVCLHTAFKRAYPTSNAGYAISRQSVLTLPLM